MQSVVLCGCGGLGSNVGAVDSTYPVGAGHEELGGPQMGIIMVKMEERTKRKEETSEDDLNY